MLKTRPVGRPRTPSSAPGHGARGLHDQRALIHLMGFLIAGLERASSRSSRVPTAAEEAEWLVDWEDAEYLYLESNVPGDASGLELDLNLIAGRIFARIRKRSGVAGRGNRTNRAGRPRS